MQPELLEKKIRSVTGDGNILIIVPPFVTTKTPILGPYILQEIAKKKGFRLEVLHLNLVLASLIGLELYESICYSQPYRFLGERLFSRSAYGLPPLGNDPDLCLQPNASVFGKNQKYRLHEFEYKYINDSPFDLDSFYAVEETCHAFVETVSQTIASLNYKIIGCSSNWEQINCSIALLNGVRKISPDITTIIGGSNCEDVMAEGIASLTDSIDYIFSGEGEAVFSGFLEQFASGNPPTGQVIYGEPINALDEIPLPDYDSYIIQRKSFLPDDPGNDWIIGYETSRGCWWGKCRFCGLNGQDRGRFRKKSVDKVLSDIEDMNQNYPARNIAMLDNAMPVSYHKDLIPALIEHENYSPMAYVIRPDLSLENLVHLAEANIRGIKPGIESLSSGLLKLMNKGVSARQNLMLLRNAASLGLYVAWNMLWGFPGEDETYYEETLKLLPLIRHCCPPEVFRHICIDRFSPYFKNPGNFQIENLRPWEVYQNIFPERADINKLAYRFIGDYPCASHDNPQIIRDIADELTLWKDHWQTSYLAITPMADYYMIYDKRGIDGQSQTHVVDKNRAVEIMTTHDNPDSENLQWAVEQKLGVIVDSTYVPLVTASPELLTQLETEKHELC